MDFNGKPASMQQLAELSTKWALVTKDIPVVIRLTKTRRCAT